MNVMRDGAIALLLGALGWVAANLIGKPLLTIRETRASIAKALVQYAKDDTGVSLTPPSINRLGAEDPTEEGRKTYLQLASALNSNLNSIPFYKFWSFIRLLPPQDSIQTAYRNLIGLSNMSGRPDASLDNTRRREYIRDALRLKL